MAQTSHNFLIGKTLIITYLKFNNESIVIYAINIKNVIAYQLNMSYIVFSLFFNVWRFSVSININVTLFM